MISDTSDDVLPSSGPFSLKELPSHSDEYDPYESALCCSGADTRLIVDGVYLLGQYAIDNRWVLFIQDQVMLEESLYIYLIGPEMVILDKLAINTWYASAALHTLSIESNNGFAFRALGRNWTLRVLQAPRFQFPFLGMPGHVKRMCLWRSYFSISSRVIETNLVET